MKEDQLYYVVSAHPSRPPMYLDMSCSVWVYSKNLAAKFIKRDATERRDRFNRRSDKHICSIEKI